MVCLAENCSCGYHQVLECLNNGQTEKSKLIIENLGNLRDATDIEGNTLLHHSINHRDAEVTQYLIDAGCNVNVQNDRGVAPLMRAIGKEDVRIIAKILKSNVDLYATQDLNKLSIMTNTLARCFDSSYFLSANQSPPCRILEMLFDNVNRDFSEDKYELKHFLMNSSNLEKLVFVIFGSENLKRFIIENGYPLEFAEHWSGYTALHCAMKFAKFDSVKFLMEIGANVDTIQKQGYSLIYSYVTNFQDADENFEILNILLRKSTCLSVFDNTCLTGMEQLLMNGQKKTVRTLLLGDINVNSYLKKSDCLVYYLICNRHLGVLDLISELNIEFDANGWMIPNEKSLLIVAAEKRCPITVQFLLDRGADVHFSSSVGTPLTSATVNCLQVDGPGARNREINDAKVTELLLQYGADAQIIVQNDRWMLGPIACRTTNEIVQEWLIDILSGPRRRKLYTKVIVAHLALLGSLDPSTLTDLTRGKIESGPLKAHFDFCTRQLQELKTLNVYGTVTMFKLLSEKEDKLTCYARNPELLSAFNAAKEKISDLDSYYVNSLDRRVSKAVDEARLQVQLSPVIGALTGMCADVYSVIVYKIISYLDRRDLINLGETKTTLNIN